MTMLRFVPYRVGRHIAVDAISHWTHSIFHTRLTQMEPTLYLMCGLPGAGKTTRARELEATTNAVRLTVDEWITHLYPKDAKAAVRDERRGRVKHLQWQVAERLLEAGTDVILDWGLWRRTDRSHYRKRAEALGARVKIEFLEAPLHVLQERIAARNLDLPPGTFHVTATEMEEFSSLFERPTAEEAEPPADQSKHTKTVLQI